MNSQNYIKVAIRYLDIELEKAGMAFKGKPTKPMQANYHPELDLEPDQANYFASLIGILR
jgi:hypothetical protein